MGKLVWRINADASQFQREMQTTARRIRDFSRTVVRLAGTGALAGFVSRLVSAGDELQKMAIRTGTNVERLQELIFAAGQAGIEMNQLSRILVRQGQAIGQATARTTEGFKRLGISMEDLRGMAPDETFRLIVERLGAIADQTERAGIAADIFGERMGAAVAQIAAQREGFESAIEQARELGTISQEQADLFARWADRAGALGTALRNFALRGLATALRFAEPFVQVIEDLVAGINALRQAISGGNLLSALREQFVAPGQVVRRGPGIFGSEGGGFRLPDRPPTVLQNPLAGLPGGMFLGPMAERFRGHAMESFAPLINVLVGVNRQQEKTLIRIEENTRVITNLPAVAG